MLTEKPMVIQCGNIKVKVPDPVAYAFHKLIISGRRIKKEKQSKDYFTAIELLRFLKRRGLDRQLKAYFDSLPETWRERIISVLKNAGDIEVLTDETCVF